MDSMLFAAEFLVVVKGTRVVRGNIGVRPRESGKKNGNGSHRKLRSS